MRITSKGQVTIPMDIREKAGLLPHTEVGFRFEGGVVRIIKIKPRKGESRGQSVVRRLRGSGTIRMSTNAILSLTRGKE